MGLGLRTLAHYSCSFYNDWSMMLFRFFSWEAFYQALASMTGWTLLYYSFMSGIILKGGSPVLIFVRLSMRCALKLGLMRKILLIRQCCLKKEGSFQAYFFYQLYYFWFAFVLFFTRQVLNLYCVACTYQKMDLSYDTVILLDYFKKKKLLF